MLVQIGQKRESDFSEPIGMLEDCHKRIRYFLKSLTTLAENKDKKPLSAERRNALEKALKYFREAAPKHTADEEESLFPRLRRLDSPQARAIVTKLNSLEGDHRWADAQHLEVDAIGRRWLSGKVLSEDDGNRLQTVLGGLLRFYERHIVSEETEIFPAARALLPASGKETLGKEMAERRGIMLQDRGARTV